LSLDFAETEEEMSLDQQVAHSFERWRDSSYRYLRSTGAAPTEAEEITQETFSGS